MKARLGMSPIAWWNDDLPELSDDVSLEECLWQARSAGFTGMEKGRRFPDDPAVMLPILRAADVTLCGGWFSGTLVDEDMAANQDRIAPMIALFKAVDAPCIVYGEVGRSIQGDRSAPLATKPKLGDDEMRDYARTLTAFGEWCAEQGMPLVYHHHMAAVVETEAELDAFMRHSGEGIPLLLDAGHLAFAGGNVLRAIDNHHARIRHVHVKDIRRPVVDGLDRTRQSFLDAVALGAFTVPGDGSLDFGAIVQRLADYGYEGWFVVEAEQDPRANPPLRMAQVGHAELMRVMTVAGYTVETQGFPSMKSRLSIKPETGSGLVHRVTPASAGWDYVGFDLWRLAPGKDARGGGDEREACLVIISGTGDFTVDGTEFAGLGGRASPFEGAGHSLYVPAGARWRVEATSALELAVCTAPGKRGARPPRVIAPGDVEMLTRGKGTNTRYPRNILPETADADSLLVVEVITPGGHTSSYPPHKHDTDDLPRESLLEETYYHRFDKPQGYAFQRVYTDDRSLDETMLVEDGDVVLVPRGYHPVAAIAGYDLYYLNVMAGPRRTWKFHNAPEHEWMLEG